ncbi:MAG: hypothetical protein PVF68_13860 [Acidobacteriota bacterium]|jgi:hypothetical protein
MDPAPLSRRGLVGILALLLLAVGLKVVLLTTSQSMADGDEAVTGLMAMHVLEGYGHPIYPWGVRYGAGAGVEVELAALLFAVFGVSDIALKAGGLVIWLATLALVIGVARRVGCLRTGLAAGLLFGFAPSATQWSLKVAGGHGTAVGLALLAVLLIEIQAPRWAVAALLPVAAIAHPIVAPFAVVLAGYLFVAGPDRLDRIRTLAALLLASAAVAALLRPPGTGVWNPAARDLDALGVLRRLPTVVLGLFTPNLNESHLPGPGLIAVAALWTGCLAAAAALHGRPRRVWLYLLAPLPVLLTVRPGELAPRHLLLLYPLACVVMGVALRELPRPARGAVLAALLVTGAGVQVHGTTDPCVHGPAPQDDGVLRGNVRDLVAVLEARGVHHVYCLDPMFQWNLTWGSRERIVARWVDPVDRFPDYPAQVDAARLAGRPVAIVGPVGDAVPRRFGIRAVPGPRALEATFPLSPRVAAASP